MSNPFEEKINLSEEQLERQEKFAELLPFIDLIKSNFNQDTADSFIEQMNKEKISFKDYDLSNNFQSYISEEEFKPDWSDLPYDTDDKEIESIILSLARNSQEQMAA